MVGLTEERKILFRTINRNLNGSPEIFGPQTKSWLKLPHFVSKHLAVSGRDENKKKIRPNYVFQEEVLSHKDNSFYRKICAVIEANIFLRESSVL